MIWLLRADISIWEGEICMQKLCKKWSNLHFHKCPHQNKRYFLKILNWTWTILLNKRMAGCKPRACFLLLSQSDLIALVYLVWLCFQRVPLCNKLQNTSPLPYSMCLQKAHHHPLLLNFKDKRFTERYCAILAAFSISFSLFLSTFTSIYRHPYLKYFSYSRNSWINYLAC